MPSFKINISNAARDVAQGVTNRSVWLALGWNDVKGRYNRSKLGVIWAGLSTLIFVSALAPIYAGLMGVELREYAMHLLLGFILWNYLSGIISESGREYINSENYLISFQLSYFTLLLRVVWRNLVVLGYQMVIFVLFAVIFSMPPNINWVVAPLGLLLITVNALWMGLLMSVFATRFRDLDELMNNILRLIFFVTPIMWMPTFKADLGLVADANPFYHLIEIVREPLATSTISWRSYLIAASMGLAGWIIAFPIFARCRSRIAFWL